MSAIFGAWCCQARIEPDVSGDAKAAELHGIDEKQVKLELMSGLSDASDDDRVIVRQVSRPIQRGVMAQRIEILQEVEMFARLSEEEMQTLAEAFTVSVFESGEVVLHEGETGTHFYLIQAGIAHVSVSSDPSFSVELGTGHWFGEKALLFDMPRKATVTAATNLALLALSREKFQSTGLHDMVASPARKCIHGENNHRQRSTRVQHDHSATSTELVSKAIKENENLKTLVETLTEEKIVALARTAQLEKVKSGSILIEQGSTNAEDDCFYIVRSGRFAVFQNATHANTRASRCNRAEMAAARMSSLETSNKVQTASCEMGVLTISKGMSFGELSLLHAAPRNANVQALEDSEVFAIDRISLRGIMEDAARQQIAVKAGYLKKIAMFEKLTQEELVDLAGVMHEFRFGKDDVILEQGAEGDTFYVMVEGKVGVYKDDKLTVELTATKSEGTSQCFGERALLQNEPRAATVKVLSDIAVMLSCDRDSFKFLLSHLFEVLTKGRSAATAKPSKKKSDIKDLVAAKMSKFGHTRRKVLKREGVLGFGALGVIELMKHRETGENYALKVMSKGYIVKSGLQERVMHTRDLLIIMNSPFIIHLIEAYSASQSLLFLMECCLGGDLPTVYNRKGFHGSLVHCKHYVASMIMAFEHMHKIKIVYRDTKPENILIDNSGTLKLVDLDCAKFSPGKTFTVCGTPEYMAPEVMGMTGHTFMVDWWGLGVLTFELLAGYTPFVAATPMQTYNRAAAGIDKVTFPATIPGQAVEFIRKMMMANPSDRLPAKPQGIQAMTKLKFWQGMDWAGLQARKLKPPFMPKVESRIREAIKFQLRPEELPPQIVYQDNGTGWDKNFETCT